MKKTFWPKIIRYVAIAAFLLIGGMVLFFFMVKWEAFGPLPGKEELKAIKNATATLVYSSDDELIGKIFDENRTNVSYENFPANLIDALIATEDARFFEHEGIDRRSILRVFVKSIILGNRSSGGGSTITQQLAKNLYGRRDFGFLTLPVNKVKEMILATRIEEIYTKEQILEHYLNTVSFSENVYGIGEGSRRFFGKDVNELHPEESAVLVGILKANTYYNPRMHPENAIGRRNLVLHQMHKYGYISESEKDSLQALPLNLSYKNLEHNAPAGYFLEHVRKRAGKMISNKVKQNGEPYDISKDGLRIHTTLNYKLQHYAEEALKAHLFKLQRIFDEHWSGALPWRGHQDIFQNTLQRSRSYQSLLAKKLSKDSLNYYLQKKHPISVFYEGKDTVMQMSIVDSVAYYMKMLHGAFLAMDPKTGAVLSWVGGLDHQYLPYDHVLAHRQSASTFKPIVYATALEQGIQPCEYIPNERRVYPEYDNWAPGNYDEKYGGLYSMSGALKHSVNVAAVHTIFETGINNVIVTARRMGIDSPIPERPSIALGTSSTTLYEMLQAYSVFANNGFKAEPYFIEKITTQGGEILYERDNKARGRLVINPDNARLITEMLRGAVNEGTGRKLRYLYGLDNDLAGKTGTAQEYTDGWFIGYNPEIVAGVWVGASSPAVHFRSGTHGSGSAMALPVFGKFFQAVNKDTELRSYSRASFKPLNERLSDKLDCEDYREEELLDKLRNLFHNEKGERYRDYEDRQESKGRQDDDQPGFFKRIFGKRGNEN